MKNMKRLLQSKRRLVKKNANLSTVIDGLDKHINYLEQTVWLFYRDLLGRRVKDLISRQISKQQGAACQQLFT